jgi:hypothetical protein
VVLLAIPAGSTIAGVFGMFIVVPLIGVVVATWRTVLFILGDGPKDGVVTLPAGVSATVDGDGEPSGEAPADPAPDAGAVAMEPTPAS